MVARLRAISSGKGKLPLGVQLLLRLAEAQLAGVELGAVGGEKEGKEQAATGKRARVRGQKSVARKQILLVSWLGAPLSFFVCSRFVL